MAQSFYLPLWVVVPILQCQRLNILYIYFLFKAFGVNGKDTNLQTCKVIYPMCVATVTNLKKWSLSFGNLIALTQPGQDPFLSEVGILTVFTVLRQIAHHCFVVHFSKHRRSIFRKASTNGLKILVFDRDGVHLRHAELQLVAEVILYEIGCECY